MIEREEKNMPK